MSNTIDGRTLAALGLSSRAPEGSGEKLGQEDFMRLMVTQLRNQDPFAPMESGDFLGQLAQFGTVSGIEQVRSALADLAGAMASSQALQAAALVDREVLVPSREAWLPSDAPVRGGIDVPPGTSGATVGVYDLNGRLVQRLPVTADSAGQIPFEWDGSLPDGSRAPSGYYELRATGEVDGASTALEVLVAGRVENVRMDRRSGTVSLTVTGLGVVNFTEVRGIA